MYLSIREGNGTPLQYSCLENPMDKEPGGLPSMGSHRVGHDCSDLAAAAACQVKKAKNLSFPVLLPTEVSAGQQNSGVII